MPDRTVGVVLVAVVVVGGLAFLQSGGAPVAPAAVQRAAAQPTPPPQTEERISCDVDARCATASYFGTDAADSDAARRELWRRQCPDFQFLVALLPDPVDSHIGWLFDPFLEALERAAEAAGYALDRFRLPWGSSASARAQCTGEVTASGTKKPSACAPLLVHEREPGVLIFRPTKAPEGENAQLFVVFLVGETPTGGVQKLAFAKALDRIAECQPASISILGPTFSGSARSLAISLEDWRRENGGWMQGNASWRVAQERLQQMQLEVCRKEEICPLLPARGRIEERQCREYGEWCRSQEAAAAQPITPFRIVSGTATSFPVAELRRVGPDGAGASFFATVISDDVVFRKFVGEYIEGRLGAPADRIALLIESNTGYGQALSRLGSTPTTARQPTPTAARNVAAEAREIPPGDAGSPTVPAGAAPTPSPTASPTPAGEAEILRLPFPMYIAGARSAWEKIKEEPTPGVPSAARPRLQVELDENREPPDLLPQMYPGMTGPAVELVLSNILATISRKQIKYVGVLASDTRDKIFLVNQIHQYCPDVRVFTFENDLLYAHPQFYTTMRGMLVASTYPLFTRTQPWTGKTEGKRLQFSNSGAEGIYNAVLALLALTAPDNAYSMVDYGPPQVDFDRAKRVLKGPRQPPIWISAVGNGGLWPVAQFEADPDGQLYVQWRDWGWTTPDLEMGSVWSAEVVWSLVSAFSVAAAVWYLGMQAWWHAPAWRVLGWRAPNRSVFWPRASHRVAQQVYTILSFGALLLLYLYQSSFFYVRSEAVGQLGRCVIQATVAILLAVVLDALVVLAFRPAPKVSRAIGRAGLATLIVAGTVYFFRVRLDDPSKWLPLHPLFAGVPDPLTQLMLDYERVLNLESNLSPLLPATFVAFIWFLWGWCQLTRLSLMERAQTSNPLPKANDLDRASFGAAQEQIRRVIVRPIRNLRIWLAGLVWAGVCVVLWASFLPTFEGRCFDHVFEVGFLFASIAIVVASAHAFSLWVEVHRLLERLSVHPIAVALGALPERVSRRMHESFYAYIPSIDDQEFVFRWWQRLRRRFNALPQGSFDEKLEEDTAGELTQSLATDSACAEAALIDARDGARCKEGEAPNETLQGSFDGLAERLVKPLEEAWGRGVLERDGQTAPAKDDSEARKSGTETQKDGKKGDGEAATDPAKAWLLDAQGFVATQMVTYVGRVFAHIRNLLAFVTVGLLLLLLTVPSYPFQPQRLLNMFVWGLVLVVVSGALYVSVQMNRSEVLSRMTGTPPNQVTVNRTLIRDLAIYGGLPLLSLLATQFPAIGGSLFSWVEPALRAMK